MSWILTQYIGGRFAVALAWSAALALSMIIIGNGIEMLREDAPLKIVLSIAALKSPVVALTALPFVIMLAALASFARLSRNSELVVTRAAGVSVWTLLAPVLVISLVIGLATAGLLNPIAAAAQSRAEALEARWLDGSQSRLSVTREGVWLRQGAVSGDDDTQTVIRAADVATETMTLRGVTFFGLSLEGAVRERLDAASATLVEGAWLLSDWVRHVVAGDPGAPPDQTRFATLELPTTLTRQQIAESFDRPEAVSFWRLPSFIAALENAGFSALRHRLHWHSQLAAPLLFGGMAMVGAAFAMRPLRFGGLGVMALAAVIAGFSLFFLTDLAKALGSSGGVPMLLAAWGPPTATLLLAAALLLNFEDG